MHDSCRKQHEVTAVSGGAGLLTRLHCQQLPPYAFCLDAVISHARPLQQEACHFPYRCRQHSVLTTQTEQRSSIAPRGPFFDWQCHSCRQHLCPEVAEGAPAGWQAPGSHATCPEDVFGLSSPAAGDISAQGIQGVSQLDSMPSLASGMGQRGSLDIDPAIAERYRQSRLQATPIPEESTDLTFSSGMQPRAGEGTQRAAAAGNPSSCHSKPCGLSLSKTAFKRTCGPAHLPFTAVTPAMRHHLAMLICILETSCSSILMRL